MTSDAGLQEWPPVSSDRFAGASAPFRRHAPPPRENLLRDVLRPEGLLFDEVQFLLRSELSNPATYNSLLAAIARGSSKLNVAVRRSPLREALDAAA